MICKPFNEKGNPNMNYLFYIVGAPVLFKEIFNFFKKKTKKLFKRQNLSKRFY